MQGAFTGKYLRVNLTEGTTAVDEFPELTYRMFMGGIAMAASILMRELKPGVDPLGPDNILVFATCPLNGIPLSGTSRFTVVTKSPLTGGYGEGEAGGWWGPELKFAGFDGIIVTGQAPKPVYLWITRRQGGDPGCRPTSGASCRARSRTSWWPRPTSARPRPAVRHRRRAGQPHGQHRERAEALQRPERPGRGDGQQEAPGHRRTRPRQARAQGPRRAAGGPEVVPRALQPGGRHAAQVRHLAERDGHERRRHPAHAATSARGSSRMPRRSAASTMAETILTDDGDLFRLRHRLQAGGGSCPTSA